MSKPGALPVTYGAKGWYWKTSAGRLGVISCVGGKEVLEYFDLTQEQLVRKALVVSTWHQKALADYHDVKASGKVVPCPVKASLKPAKLPTPYPARRAF